MILTLSILVALLLVVALCSCIVQKQYVRETYKNAKRTPRQLLFDATNGDADPASADGTSVTLYSGAQTKDVVLERVVASIPDLTSVKVTDQLVTLRTPFEMTFRGALHHDTFDLHPIAFASAFATVTTTFRYSGKGAARELRARKNVIGRASRAVTLRLRAPNVTCEAHDLARRTAPTVPEIFKVADVSGIAMRFNVGPSADSSVTVLLMKPTRAVAITFRVLGGGMFVCYHQLQGTGTTLLHTLIDQAQAATRLSCSRAVKQGKNGSDCIVLKNVRTAGVRGATIFAECVSGEVRVCVRDAVSSRAYWGLFPVMLSHKGLRQTNANSPAKAFVVKNNVERALVLPFPVLDLSALEE